MNRYAQHKMDIKRICEERNVDIGVACAILRDEMGWHFPETDGIDREITEFTSMISKMSGEEVKAYFAG